MICREETGVFTNLFSENCNFSGEIAVFPMEMAVFSVENHTFYYLSTQYTGGEP